MRFALMILERFLSLTFRKRSLSKSVSDSKENTFAYLCQFRLGHSRASLFLHRLTIVGIFLGLILLLFIAIPFFILTAPCLLCCRYKKIKDRLKNFTKLGQRFQQQQHTPTAHPSPSGSLNQLNSSSVIDIEQESRLIVSTPLLSPSSTTNDERQIMEISTVWCTWVFLHIYIYQYTYIYINIAFLFMWTFFNSN